MFETLRSRLLLSYSLVIAIALVLIALVLFGLTALAPGGIRTQVEWQTLAAISQSTRYELERILQRTNARGQDVEELLKQTAVNTNTRIVAADAQTSRVVFDSDPSQSWLGDVVRVTQPSRGVPEADGQNTVVGRFKHKDTNWLVYGQQFNDSRLVIFYAHREQTTMAFFQQYFLTPLAGAGILAFVISIFLAFWMARSVVQPLHLMAGTAHAVAQGDYDQHLSLQGPREVQSLAQSLNTMSSKVKQSQQMQKDFVANVSHDLKTPLTSIQGWSMALLDGTAVDPDIQQQAATVIYDESERMARMVGDLLDIARLDAGQVTLKQQPVELAQLLNDVVRNLTARAQEQGVTLSAELTQVEPIRGDDDRLMQIFTNLADNALTHTPAGGRVTLALWPKGAQQIQVQIKDTGHGIPAEALPRIFERFYQVDQARTRNEGSGSGLGLAIVKQLVETHGGTIEVESQLGVGTTFTIVLPVA